MGAAGSEGWDGRLFEDPVGREERLQLVVPGLLQEEVLTDLHEGELGGHLKIEKMLARRRDSTGQATTKMCRIGVASVRFVPAEKKAPIRHGPP